MAQEIAGPPAITLASAIDGDELFNITVGEPGVSCKCEEPKCAAASSPLSLGETLTYRASNRCHYYNIGGAIRAKSDGTICYTFRADYKSCEVTPGDAYKTSFTSAGADTCSRLVGASCTMRTSVDAAGAWKEYPTVITLTGPVDTNCDTLPWLVCTDASSCCGGTAGFSCLRKYPNIYGNDEKMCQPPYGGPHVDLRMDSRVFEAWEAKGVKRFNGQGTSFN